MITQKLASAFATAIDRGPLIMTQAAGRLAMAEAQKRFLNRRYLLRRIHSYRMLLDTEDSGLSRSLLLFRTREVDHKVMLERILRPGMMVFDIGGNIGYYPLMELSLLNGSGRMVVVEPSPANVELLKKNLALNGYHGVPVIEAAVSDKPGTRTFYLSKQSNLGTFHPIGTGASTLSGDTVAVETTTVPALAKQYGAPDLLRMDVEGHEVEVINGMLDDIRGGNYAPIIIFETHLSRYSDEHDMAATLRALFALGYAVPLLSSSSDHGTERLKALGYRPGERIATDGIHRTLFSDIKPDDAIDIICRTGGARTVVLSKRPNGSGPA